MDADYNLAGQLTIAGQIAAGCPMETHEEIADWYEGRAQRLADLVLSLDEYIRKGGSLPAGWQLGGIRKAGEAI